MAQRVAVAVVAIAAIAWLAIGYRSTVLSERGERLAERRDQTAAQVREAQSTLQDARFLNPDTRPLFVEGFLLVSHDRYEDGIELLEQGVRREPDNVVGWGILAQATARTDPARSRQARAEILRLSPPVNQAD